MAGECEACDGKLTSKGGGHEQWSLRHNFCCRLKTQKRPHITEEGKRMLFCMSRNFPIKKLKGTIPAVWVDT